MTVVTRPLVHVTGQEEPYPLPAPGDTEIGFKGPGGWDIRISNTAKSPLLECETYIKNALVACNADVTRHAALLATRNIELVATTNTIQELRGQLKWSKATIDTMSETLEAEKQQSATRADEISTLSEKLRETEENLKQATARIEELVTQREEDRSQSATILDELARHVQALRDIHDPDLRDSPVASQDERATETDPRDNDQRQPNKRLRTEEG